MLDTGRTVTVGDAVIRPGDYVVADADGVVVIPTELRDKVLGMAEAAAADEPNILDEVRKGMPPLDAFLVAIGETS